jgi:hypothetical protein
VILLLNGTGEFHVWLKTLQSFIFHEPRIWSGCKVGAQHGGFILMAAIF